jgi:hypothetical protein
VRKIEKNREIFKKNGEYTNFIITNRENSNLWQKKRENDDFKQKKTTNRKP